MTVHGVHGKPAHRHPRLSPNLVGMSMDFLETSRHALRRIQYFGRPHADYYRALMRDDVKAGKGAMNPYDRPLQLERLIAHGMKPQHTLLDIGCGYLRGAVPIIEYLDEGNYTGTDISPDILSLALPTKKRRTLLISKDNSFDEVQGTFDFIQANSVLTLLAPDQIEQLLSNVHKVMHEGSIFLANLPLSDKIRTRMWKRYYSYPFDWLAKVARNHALKVEHLPQDAACRGKTELLKFTLS